MKDKLEKRIEFKTTQIDYKLIQMKASEAGFSVAQYCRSSALSKRIEYKLNVKEVEAYLLLQKYTLNFKNLSNLFKAKDPELSTACKELVFQFREELKKFQ